MLGNTGLRGCVWHRLVCWQKALLPSWALGLKTRLRNTDGEWGLCEMGSPYSTVGVGGSRNLAAVVKVSQIHLDSTEAARGRQMRERVDTMGGKPAEGASFRHHRQFPLGSCLVSARRQPC